MAGLLRHDMGARNLITARSPAATWHVRIRAKIPLLMLPVRKDVKLTFVRNDVKLRWQYLARGGGVCTLTNLEMLEEYYRVPYTTFLISFLEVFAIANRFRHIAKVNHHRFTLPRFPIYLEERSHEYLVTENFSQYHIFAIIIIIATSLIHQLFKQIVSPHSAI
jgi:hypothetical protein